MGKLCRQSLKHERIEFWKLGGIMFATIIIMNILMGWASRFGAVVSSGVAVLTLILGTVICFRLIYQYLAQYEYRVIDQELILERALGRANHVVLTINLDEIIQLQPYKMFINDNEVKGIQKMVLHRNQEDWHVVTYKKENKAEGTAHIVFEPDESFLEGLKENLSESGSNS